MVMKLLDFPEDVEAIDISRVDEQLDGADADMELPQSFTSQDDAELLVQGAQALENIFLDIRANGIDRTTAKALYAAVQRLQAPGLALEGQALYAHAGGAQQFTAERSIDGLACALESIKDSIADAFKRIIERVKQVYRTFMEWLKAKFASAAPEAVKPSEAAKAAVRNPNIERIAKFLDSVGENPAEAAAEVARMAPGAPDSFRAGLVTEFETLGQRLKTMFEKISQNKSYARIVAGDVSVKELLKEEADGVVNTLIGEASTAAQAALTCRNAQQLEAALERVLEVTAKLDEVSQSTFSTQDEAFEGTDEGVQLSRIIANVKEAVHALESSNMDKAIKELTHRLQEIMRTAEQTSKEEIDEMIPADANDALRAKAVTSVIALYAKLAGMGQAIAKLWGSRINSLRAINLVLGSVTESIASLERGVSRLARSLEQEPREALTKALAAKGFVIEV